ncbi:ABC transporter substrate-binding protein [Pontibacillus litoralis]|uniref:Nitrate ABC transporter substrate-binding protein n=1 Tax=Pontibacillus litoralis JSM 072002 TaxID=1385512 RepID=A0A0A5G1S0_9BACI|nr:ABC transporter substrate-binding protein [Pontibacillus litoralis]KGX87031.1 nitrate ABC transporter substrate-binding protein [Pontibacillus litoralis JSM 072002]
MKKLFFSLFALVVLTACGNEEAPSSEGNAVKKPKQEEVTLVLDWTPNTNHTGLYVAQDKGYFEEAGLHVEIQLPGEAGADQLVASGKADFGVSAQEALTEARVQDIPIVSIGAIIQHNTSGFASPKDKNITSPADYEGKTYGGWGAPVEEAVISSIMSKEDADVNQVEFINMGNTDFFTAVERDVDFAWIYYGWTGIEAELREQELNMQYLTDYSEKLDYYTPILTTNETMIEENPATVEAFMRASTKGYEYAINNPEDAANILIEAVPDLDAELVKASQEWLSPKYQDDAEQWGHQDAQVWKNYSEWMFDNNLLDKQLNVEEAYTNEFLPEQ